MQRSLMDTDDVHFKNHYLVTIPSVIVVVILQKSHSMTYIYARVGQVSAHRRWPFPAVLLFRSFLDPRWTKEERFIVL